MPITYRIEPSKNTVFTTITGSVFDSDPVEYLSEVLAHPDYRLGSRGLVVCRDVDLGGFSTEAIRRLVDFTRRSERDFEGSRIAVVAEQPAVYGLVRMYALLRDAPYELRVFREIAQAETWLAGDGPDPEAQ